MIYAIYWQKYESKHKTFHSRKCINMCQPLNSLWPRNAIRQQGTESTAPSHYLNQCDLSSVRSCGIHQMALSWEDLKIPISKTRLKITFLESHSDLTGANEFMAAILSWLQCVNCIPVGHWQPCLVSHWYADKWPEHAEGSGVISTDGWLVIEHLKKYGFFFSCKNLYYQWKCQ